MRRQTFIIAQPGNDRPLHLDTTSARAVIKTKLHKENSNNYNGNLQYFTTWTACRAKHKKLKIKTRIRLWLYISINRICAAYITTNTQLRYQIKLVLLSLLARNGSRLRREKMTRGDNDFWNEPTQVMTVINKEAESSNKQHKTTSAL